MVENRLKRPLNIGVAKKRCRVKSQLKMAARTYIDDHTQLQEMEKLMKELKLMNRAGRRTSSDRRDPDGVRKDSDDSANRRDSDDTANRRDSDDTANRRDSDDTANRRDSDDTTHNTDTVPKDRFTRYMETAEEDVVQPPEPKCILDSFESIFEPVDADQIEETVDDKMEEIRRLLRSNRVVIIEGNTGCGKTTKIPRLLMGEYKNIVCTQPRKLAAISVARKVSSDIGCELGSTVGYAVRFDNKSSEATRLKFVTDGILIREVCSHGLRRDSETKIAGYDLIVIDEAHERTVNIDLLLGCIKRILGNTSIETRILIMSATLNTERLKGYFNSPLVSIRHRMHEIEYFYLKADCKNYTQVCVKVAKEIIQSESGGDVLVFLTGQDDIERAYQLLSPLKSPKLTVLKLFSTMPPEEQDLIFKETTRKIVLTTNIAETSITIENVRFVIDSGKFKSKEYNVADDIDHLDVRSISKAQAKQRAGRAGRTQPGRVFRIFSYETYQSMIDNPVPEILRSRLHSTVLAMKSLGVVNVYKFDYIDSPFSSALERAEAFLYYIRAISSKGVITSFGRRLVQLPLEPETAVSLFAARNIGCLNSVATIAAFLDFQTPFLDIRPESDEYGNFRKAKLALTHPSGDFYTFLGLFYAWQQTNFAWKFLKRNYLNVRTMMQIRNTREQILRLFPGSKDKNLDIEKAFSTGFFMKAAKICDGGYKTLFGGVECNISTKDPLYSARSKYVIFYGIFYNRKEYMVHTLEVSGYDLFNSINNFVVWPKR